MFLISSRTFLGWIAEKDLMTSDGNPRAIEANWTSVDGKDTADA